MTMGIGSGFRLGAVRGWLFAFVLACSVLVGLGSVSSAHGVTITYWKATPKGTVGTNLPIIVEGGGAWDGSAMNGATAKMYVDGVLLPRTAYTGVAKGTRNVYFYYAPAVRLADGLHTFRVEMADLSGKVSAYQWNATVAQPPDASWIEPASGSVSYDGRPEIVMALADNTPGTSFSVSGEVRAVSAVGPTVMSFGGSGLAAGDNSFALPTELAPGTYFLTSTVRDGAGNVRSLQGVLARSLIAQAAPAMTVFSSDCMGSGCHEASGHPATTTSCESCHVVVYHEYEQCSDCHAGHSGPVTVTGRFGTCEACHSAKYPSVPRHSNANSRASHEGSCDGCHQANLLVQHAVTPAGSYYAYQCGVCHLSTDPAVVEAVSGGDTSCSACHGAYDHGVSHVSSLDAACADCHEADLVAEHDIRGFACLDCHANQDPAVVEAIGGANPSKECVACHQGIDFTQPHGYSAEAHVSNETCLGSCHSAELPSAHDAQVTGTVASGCPDCHPSPASSVTPWDGLCAGCHSTIDHASAGPSHVGSEVGVRFMKGTSNTLRGCSDTAGYNRGCHDLSSVTLLHARRSDKGCAVCHGPGASPSEDCISCHLKYTTGETRTGLLSAAVAPTGDGEVTSGASVSPASPVSRWDKVADTPGTVGDYDGSYVSYDALDGGFTRSLYTFQPPQFPSATFDPPATARVTITAVRLYYRARRVGTSTLPKLGASVSVGGTAYNLTAPAAVTPAAAYPTGAAPAYFNLTTNPKTGAAWTYEDLTDVASENALTAFGLYSTNVTNPIRVSQCYLVVAYNVTLTTTASTQSNSAYHHNNVKYLNDPADAPEGQRYAFSPPNGWTGVLFEQDCQDKCHINYWGPAVYSAHQGTYMWHSMAGAGGNPVTGPTTRTLTLNGITLPSDSPRLEFMTNWRLNSTGRTTSTGYVEVSVDDGATFTPVSGIVDGVERTSFTENGTNWVPAIYDLSAFAGQDVKLRFRFVAGTDNAAGWAFDSMAVLSDSGVVFSDDAETLKPEWTNGYWNRSIGAFIYQ